MKGWELLVLAALITAAASGCSRQEEPDVAPLSSSEISGARLWSRITGEAPYETYGFWENHEGMNPGQAPHGTFHRIFINSRLLDTLPRADRTAPQGTIIVKENYTVTKQLDSFTVMVKVEGYNPEAGDWFWAKYAPDGTVQVEGTPGGCISCHGGLKSNDYVITHPLDEE